MARDPGRGTMILVMGILSLVCCPLVGPLAWIWGRGDLQKIQSGEIAQDAEQLTKIGMILGIIGTVFLVIDFFGLCVWGIILAIGIAGASKVKTTMLVMDAIASLI
jgi:hypothetical protein